MSKRLPAVFLIALATGTVLGETPKPTREGLEFFEKKIRPVLVQNCYQCHSSKAKAPKGGLLLDTREGLLKGGESGAALVPGNAEDSLIVEALRHDGLEMPPSGKLADDIIADFVKWIDMGAPDPREAASAGYVHKEINFDEARKFWAFQPPKQAPPPTVKSVAWPRGDIDRFVLAKLEEKGVQPNGDADRTTLIRRVTFDLIGLPPTPEEIDAFLADTSQDAFAKVVDRLLALPQFGERWGRHWLDVARYAESTGKERNVPFPNAWRYRDYVIDSFNADKPYDQFVREQIAGDLLESDTPQLKNERLVATGFLAIGPKGLNEKNAEQYLMDEVDEQVDTATRAILATTVGCARCHDHKFDPIPTSDYYALAGIFRSTATLSGVKRGDRQFNNQMLLAMMPMTAPSDPEAAAKQHADSDEVKKLEAELSEAKATLERAQKQAKKARKKNMTKAELKGMAPKKLRQRIAALEEQIAGLRGSASGLALAMGVREGSPADVRICIRGEVNDRGPSVPRGFLTVTKTPADPKLDPKHSGRKELAEWLSSRTNPLTARVMANRVWQHLFGTGIVETVDNFGQLGERPTHPELLDHLAVRFMDNGWSVKKLIREIVLSRAYQLSSEHSEASYAADPANRFLWRMSRRRMDAESIRDALLAASGRLDLKRPEGSPVQTIGNGEIGRQISSRSLELNSTHRSVYLPILRGIVPEMLSVFDVADPNLVVGQREVTTVATQALYLMNSPFVIEQSEHAARRVLDRQDLDDAARIDLAYRLALGRAATPAEQQTSAKFLRECTSDPKTTSLAAWTSLCQAIFATSEFRYIY